MFSSRRQDALPSWLELTHVNALLDRARAELAVAREDAQRVRAAAHADAERIRADATAQADAQAAAIIRQAKITAADLVNDGRRQRDADRKATAVRDAVADVHARVDELRGRQSSEHATGSG